MSIQDQPLRFKLLALAIACVLGLPLAAQAQAQTTASADGAAAAGNSATTAQLERRVDELQQEVAQLKQMIEARQTATPAPAPAAQPVAEAPATPTFTTGKGLSMALHGFISATAVTPLNCSVIASSGVPAAALRARVFLTTE